MRADQAKFFISDVKERKLCKKRKREREDGGCVCVCGGGGALPFLKGIMNSLSAIVIFFIITQFM